VKKAAQTMTRRLNTILKGLEKLPVKGKCGETERRPPPIQEPVDGPYPHLEVEEGQGVVVPLEEQLEVGVKAAVVGWLVLTNPKENQKPLDQASLAQKGYNLAW